MTRRNIGRALAGSFAAQLAGQVAEPEKLIAPPGYSVTDMGGLKRLTPDQPEQIVMLLYPGMTALDLIGPQQTFGYTQGCKVHLVWKNLDPITTDTGLKITPSDTLQSAPEPDLIFAPGGGAGTVALMADPEVVGYLAAKGKTARWITSVCSGSLLLGAAGLLRGYRATSHWAVRDVLPSLGAQLAPGRVVEDRNRITAGGVTAGIDFGLYLTAKLRGEDYARAVQLMLEYDPKPPFESGTPAQAKAVTTAFATQLYAPLRRAAQAAADRARAGWGG